MLDTLRELVALPAGRGRIVPVDLVPAVRPVDQVAVVRGVPVTK